MFRRAIALIVSLVLMPVSGWGLICAVNCNHMAPMKPTIEGDSALTAHQHSHHHDGATMNSACCPAGAQVAKSGCAPNVQFSSAVEGRLRVNFDSAAIALTPIISALGAHSEATFLSSSPPASLLRTVVPTLRI